MKIISMIDELKAQHAEHITIRKNGTILINVDTIPKAQHMLFEGLTDALIEKYLSAAYKNKLPNEYVELLKYTNGMALFMFKIQTTTQIKKGRKTEEKVLEFAGTNLSVFGLPRTQPFGRALDMEEPYDVRIEDLRRHDSIPDSWLQVGRYVFKHSMGGEASIYIDCDTQKVYATLLDDFEVIEGWDSFDTCLCDLFHRGEESELSYFYN